MTIENLSLVRMKSTGDVLLIHLIKNNQDFGSMAYDQEYEALDYDKLLDLASKDSITPIELESCRLSNLVVKNVTTLPFEYVKDVAPEIPPIRIVEHTTYSIEVANPKQIVNTVWEFDKYEVQ